MMPPIIRTTRDGVVIEDRYGQPATVWADMLDAAMRNVRYAADHTDTECPTARIFGYAVTEDWIQARINEVRRMGGAA